MSKKRDAVPQVNEAGLGSLNQTQTWQPTIAAVALRFNQEYQGKAVELPAEVQEMPIAQERVAGLLQAKQMSPFWQVAKPQKNQRCLDLGCGISFLIYPWREWEAQFFGQEVSTEAQGILNARGPQLNSKLFKGVKLGPAHQLVYEPGQFDLVIATGFSCYYAIDYWAEVIAAVKKVLKPGGFFVFDVLNAELPLAENWAILETYLGAEVLLESLADWEKLIKAEGGKINRRSSGELFQLYKVGF